MWLLLALFLRPLLKLLGVVTLWWLALCLIQILAAIPVAAWEASQGATVPDAVYHGLSFALLGGLLALYRRRRRRSRAAQDDGPRRC